MPVTQTMTQTMPLTATLAMTASILKLRIGSFVALAGLVGILTSGGTMGWVQAMIFTLAVLGASGAAGAYNQYYERETDKLMARTFNRPFARGLLRPGPVWPLTFLALLAGSLAMAWSVGGTLATVLVFLGAATYAIVYTVWLKRRSVWNVVIGGASGSFAMLAGAAAASDPYGPVIGPVPLLLAGALFLWTPPHFWALAAAKGEDYRRAGIPMLPVVTEHAVGAGQPRLELGVGVGHAAHRARDLHQQHHDREEVLRGPRAADDLHAAQPEEDGDAEGADDAHQRLLFKSRRIMAGPAVREVGCCIRMALLTGLEQVFFDDRGLRVIHGPDGVHPVAVVTNGLISFGIGR